MFLPSEDPIPIFSNDPILIASFDKSVKNKTVEGQSSAQQVSFQVCEQDQSRNLTPVSGKVNNFQQPLTPTIIGSEVLDKIQSHIEEMDVVDKHGNSVK